MPLKIMRPFSRMEFRERYCLNPYENILQSLTLETQTESCICVKVALEYQTWDPEHSSNSECIRGVRVLFAVS